MGYYSLVVPRESAWDVVNVLGDLSCLHFVDHDATLPLINRPFANYIKRCDETLARIEVLESRLRLFKRPIVYCEDLKELLGTYQRRLANRYTSFQTWRTKPGHSYFDELEHDLDLKANLLDDQLNTLNNLIAKKNNILEKKAVLLKGNDLLGQTFIQKLDQPSDGTRRDQEGVNFSSLVGVIAKEDEQRFKRTIFRMTKGNAWVNIMDIVAGENQEALVDIDENPIMKAVFVIVFPGSNADGHVRQRLTKVAEAFNATYHEFPPSQNLYEAKLIELDAQFRETINLISLTRERIENYLEDFSAVQAESGCSLVIELKLYVVREKYIYQTLNMMKMQGSIFCGSFWMPHAQTAMVEQAMRRVQRQDIPMGQIQLQAAPSDKSPPTAFRLNDFNWTYQEIVNTYGVPRYEEVNPGLFTIVTFPFLFAVMFGDIGHGSLLLFFALYLVFFKDRIAKSDSIFKEVLIARYMFLMMGLFAVYVGWIYNDFLSLAINAFGSCYDLVDNEWERVTDTCNYPFGLDPAWRVANNELSFVNSFKMKLAVIIAVVHMTFGIFLKGANAIYFESALDFFCEFIPQLVFLICTFGYMDFLIIVKWLTVYPPEEAPSIITTMIDMVLNPFSLPTQPIWGDGTQQHTISLIFLTTAVFCVPLMLFPKPFILDAIYNKGHKAAPKPEAHPEHQDFQKLSQEDHLEVPSVNVQEVTPLISEGGEPVESPEEQKQALSSPEKQREAFHAHEEEHKSQSGYNESQFGRDFEKATQPQPPEQLVVHIAPAHTSNEHEFSELFVHQVIETIEFVLGSISNTASYLRLWALSLAHGQLAEVFYHMTLSPGIEHGGAIGIVQVIFGYTLFACATFGVLMLMDLMECFLHALRLHWVEFQNKFYKADGYLFAPFSFTGCLRPLNEAK